MTAHKAVTDEQLGKYARRTRALQEALEKGTAPYEDTMDGLQLLFEGKALVPVPPTAVVDDPLRPFRKIRGLTVVGPKEWEKAMRGADRRNRNPLNLAPGWCPQVPVPYTAEQMKRLVEICQTQEWATTPVLWLALPKVGSMPTSLVNQRNWWGVKHDEFEAGKVRSDIMWSGWFSGQPWANEPAVTEPTWMIGYELSRWTTGWNWNNQQEAARKRNMPIAIACRDALMCNLVAIAAGKKFRTSTYSRTVTVYDGYPLYVRWGGGYGLYVGRYWHPVSATGYVGASVEGVPVELGS